MSETWKLTLDETKSTPAAVEKRVAGLGYTIMRIALQPAFAEKPTPHCDDHDHGDHHHLHGAEHRHDHDHEHGHDHDHGSVPSATNAPSTRAKSAGHGHGVPGHVHEPTPPGAEATVPVTTSRTGRVYRTTTRLRSEVGAIESIEILPATDKRLFSAAEAVQAFVDPSAFPGYQVELFEVPPLNAIETDRWGRRQLFESLFKLLTSLGNGTRSYLLPAVGRTPMLEV